MKQGRDLMFYIAIFTLLFVALPVPNCYKMSEVAITEMEETPQLEVTDEIFQEIRSAYIETPINYIRLSGDSMYPTIEHGNICVCMNKNNYNKNDIIIYRSPEEYGSILISHRITDISPFGYITKGDNSHRDDPWIVPNEEVVCKIDYIPYYRRVMQSEYIFS